MGSSNKKSQNFINDALLSAALDGAPDCVFILDGEGLIKWINHYGVVLFDVASAENLKGKSHQVLWANDDLPVAIENLKTAKKGKEARFRCELRHLNGISRLCDVVYQPLRNPTGKNGYVIGFARPIVIESEEEQIRDHSERLHSLNEELCQKNERLHELDKMKTEFLNTISHDLRTPLTSLKWSADNVLILLHNTNDDNMKRLLKIIRDDSDRLNNLVERLLDFSRIEAGKVKLRRKVIEVKIIIEHGADRLKNKFKEKALRLETDIPPGLPEVWVDRFKIESALINLLDNSIKYSPKGEKILIEVRQQDDPLMVRVSIRDNGTGISAENLKKVFDKFYRTAPPGEISTRGTGLGLSIAKSFIEQHGGRIWCESVVGKGTTFHFTLPPAIEEE